MSGPLRRRWELYADPPYRKLSRTYRLPGGYRRIYCYHIRKTGGTSLNHGFMSLGHEEPLEVQRRISESKDNRTITGQYAITAFHRENLARGHYFYGWAHRPAHVQTLPPKTFTITILRDPVDRVRSYFDYLVVGDDPKVPDRVPDDERRMASDGFPAFLNRLPERDLLRQLYMFSAAFDVSEAAERILTCSHIHFLEDNESGVTALAQRLELPLVARRERVTGTRTPLATADHDRLRELLDPEYELLRRLRDAGIGRGGTDPGIGQEIGGQTVVDEE